MHHTGDVLQNRYRIVSLLGQGGMGAVYRAWDIRLKIPVAIKEMIPQPGLEAQTLTQLRQQFQQEAQVLARLNHPHLVRVSDFFEEGGNAYLVMDFVEGQSMAELIAQQGALPETRVLAWADQLLDALAYCHSKGVLHRDIKPQNVIIRPDGRAVLVDFGLVKLWDPRDPRTRSAMRGMGTPEYAPPEQYGVAGHTDPRSDLYSLGATLYHALTGRTPPEVTDRIADPSIFRPPRAIIPHISSRMEVAILKAMEMKRDSRWISAAEMAQGMGLSVQDWQPKPYAPPPTRGDTLRIPPAEVTHSPATTVAAPATSEAKARPWQRGKPWLWILAGSLALAGLIAWMVKLQQESQQQLYFMQQALHATEQAKATANVQATAQAEATTTAQAYANRPEISVENATWIQPLQTIYAHDGWISGIAFSPDGSLLASSSWWDNTVKVWQFRYGKITEEPLFTIQYDAQVDDVVFSPDGQILASAGCNAPFSSENPCNNGIVYFYSTNDWRLIRTIEAHYSFVSAVSFSPDGNTLASASADGTVRLWRVADGALLRTLEGHTEGVSSVAFSPDGQTLASASCDGTVRLWRVANGALLHKWQEHTFEVYKAIFSPDGHLVAAIGGDNDPILVAWDVENGEVVYKRSDHRLRAGSIIFNLDGLLIITGGGHEDHIIQVRQASNGIPLTALRGHNSWVADMAISPDGRLLVSGGGDGFIIVWGIP